MRWCLVFLLFCPSATNADETPPLEVVIVGVSSIKGVQKYRDSPIGEEAVKVCNQLVGFFNSRQVHVTPLCTDAETTHANVNDKLVKQFHGPNRRRTTLLFLMTHGEPTEDGDVRLLMSDSTDTNKTDHSILLREQLEPMLANATDSVTIGFIDTCYSGAADGYRLASLGIAAEKEGVHFGLLASAQAYQQSFDLSFTKALVETCKADCPQNPDDFISAVLGRMNEGGSSPVWLVTYHGSACFGELLNPNKRVLSIWRDSARKIRVSVFDDRHNPQKPLRTIPPGVNYINPYLQAVVPGVYRVETRDEEDLQTVLDTKYCDVSDESTVNYCEYSFPLQTNGLVSLNLHVQTYGAAAKLGYSDTQLGPLVNDTASVLARIQPGPARSEASKLVASSPALVSAMIQQDLFDGSKLEQHGEHLSEFEKAIEVGNKAVEAQQTAQQAMERVQTVESVVANLDTYQVSSTVEISLKPRQDSLTKSEMAALDKVVVPLKNQRGYIIEVQAFSSGPKKTAQARSQNVGESVVRYLVLQHNIPVYRIYVVGMGNASQSIDNATNGRAPDRIEVRVLKNPVEPAFANSPHVVPPA